MNTERIKILLTVLDAGSITAAAEQLHYTPSGISRMMAALEAEMGFPLLHRSREGASPTENCRALLPDLRKILACEENCRQTAEKILGLQTGTIRIGIAYSSLFVKMEERIRTFRERHPGIDFRLRSGFTSELLEELTEHRLDLCLVSFREGPFEWHALMEDEMLGWVPADHPSLQNGSLPVTAFEEEPYIEIHPGKDIDNRRILTASGIRPNKQMEAGDSYAAWCMVESGLGITLNNSLNSAFSGEGVRCIPLSPRQTIQIGIASLEDCSPAARAFLEEIQRIE